MSIPSVNRQQSIVCPLHTIPIANHVESNKNSEKKNKPKNSPGLDPKQNSANRSAVSPASAKTPDDH